MTFKNILINTSLFIFFIFALAGLIIINIVIHEYSHYQDVKEYSRDEVICGLILPKTMSEAFGKDSLAGYMAFDYSSKDKEQVSKIMSYTEIKAYSISIIIALIFLIISLVTVDLIIEGKLYKHYQGESQ